MKSLQTINDQLKESQSLNEKLNKKVKEFEMLLKIEQKKTSTLDEEVRNEF